MLIYIVEEIRPLGYVLYDWGPDQDKIVAAAKKRQEELRGLPYVKVRWRALPILQFERLRRRDSNVADYPRPMSNFEGP